MAILDERRIVLASGSPRRRELLTHVGFDPVIVRTDVPEVKSDDESPEEYTLRLAKTKAMAARALLDDDAPRWVLAADTIVVHNEVVLEKPADHDDAVAMLERLGGSWHEVITAFCWLDRDTGETTSKNVSTEVLARDLSTEWIERYVATREPMDKAGAYGIQDIGGTIVREIRGSYSTVVGLPLCEVVETLEELGGLTQFPFPPV